jgi:hypothetical protein
MIRRLTVYATSALCALLCGCLVSLHPLSSPAEAAPDPQLLGVWVAHDKGEDLMYLHIGLGKKGMTEAMLVEHGEDGRYKVSRYSAFPTKIEGMSLLNVIAPEEHKDTRGYDIMRYQVDGNSLSLALMSEDAVKHDITDGKLEGKVEPGTYGDTTITASSRELLAYIKSADPSRLFPESLKFEPAADPGGR